MFVQNHLCRTMPRLMGFVAPLRTSCSRRLVFGGENNLSIRLASTLCGQTHVTTRVMSSDCESKQLTDLSSDERKRLAVLKLEYDVLLSTGVRVPRVMTDEMWSKLMYGMESFNARKKYYNYLFKTEKLKEKDKSKSMERQRLQEIRRKEIELLNKDSDMPFKNTFMLKVQQGTWNRWYANNLCYALMNGPHVVFDFSFEHAMKEEEINSLIKQFQDTHGVNKVDREPFHFTFCNLKSGSKCEQKLMKAIGNYHELPYTFTEKSYLDCYSKDQLVYLSPNAPQVLNKFSYDDVYIVGAIVDKATEEPLTLAKAKKEGLRCVRLPLDENVKWVCGKKSLCINHVVSILLDVKKSGDWNQTLFRQLPSRKFDKNFVPAPRH